MKPSLMRLTFPTGGVNEAFAYSGQPKGTTPMALNVRPFDSIEGRARGGQRPGLRKYVSSQLNTTADIQDITTVVVAGTGTLAATALSNRNVYGYAVAGGICKKFTSSGWTTLTGGGTVGSEAFSTGAPMIFSTDFFGDVFYADGVNTKYVDVSAAEVKTWSAVSGTFPSSGTEYPRLIDRWNGRIVMAGLRPDPQNWFMSAQADATNWNYSPTTITETQAVAGGNSTLGKTGDIINTIIPYSDDLLWFGCDHEIWQLSGDPMAGGRLDCISDTIGMAFGRPWARDPQGRIYFWGSRGGVFRMSPGQGLERITSGVIDERTADIDLNTCVIRMAWNDREQGLYVWVTGLTDRISNNLFYDSRTNTWWLDEYDDVDFYPRAVHVMDGDQYGDRQILLGCKDGYIRSIDNEGLNDDGTAINSFVVLGPIRAPRDQTAPFVVAEIQGALAQDSDDVEAKVYVGETETDAFNAITSLTGIYFDSLMLETGGRLELEAGRFDGVYSDPYTMTLTGNRTVAHHPRKRGYAAYIKLANTATSERWAMEWLQVKLHVQATNARRQWA